MTVDGVGLRSSRGPVLLAIMVSVAPVGIDSTILAAAVPSVVDDLGGFSAFPWLFSIYLLAQAVTVPIYSKLSDVLGRKSVLLFGLVLFVLGSALCGFSWNMGALIAFRGLQGIGAGAIQPMAMTLTGDLYSASERARVQAYIGSVWATSSVIGPSLGGLLAQFVGWRWIFFVNVPICALAIVLIVSRLQEKVHRKRQSINYAGAAALSIATASAILGILEGGVAWPWASPASVTVFGVSAVAVVIFVCLERRAAEPVLPGWLFRRRLLMVPILTAMGTGASLVGLSAFVPDYVEKALGVSPLVGGLVLASLSIGWPVSSVFAGRVYLRIGYRNTALIGVGILVLSTAGLALAAHHPALVPIALLCFAIGWGLGFTSVPGIVAAQSSVTWGERGVVTGAAMFGRSIGSAVGTAVLGAVANAVLSIAKSGEPREASIDASAAVFVCVSIIAVLIAIANLFWPPTPPRHDGAQTPTDPVSAGPLLSPADRSGSEGKVGDESVLVRPHCPAVYRDPEPPREPRSGAAPADMDASQ